MPDCGSGGGRGGHLQPGSHANGTAFFKDALRNVVAVRSRPRLASGSGKTKTSSDAPLPHAILVFRSLSCHSLTTRFLVAPRFISPLLARWAPVRLFAVDSSRLGKPCLWRSGARSKRKGGQGDSAQHEHRVVYLLYVSSFFFAIMEPTEYREGWYTDRLSVCYYKVTTAKESLSQDNSERSSETTVSVEV